MAKKINARSARRSAAGRISAATLIGLGLNKMNRPSKSKVHPGSARHDRQAPAHGGNRRRARLSSACGPDEGRAR